MTPYAVLVAEAFGLGTPIARLAPVQHTVSETWKLRTTSGSYLVKRLWRGDDPPWAPKLRWMTEFERRASTQGVRTPQPIEPRHPAFGTVGHVPGVGAFRVYEWLEHRKLRPADDVTAWLGETLAKLHGLEPLDHVPEPQYYGIYPESTWARWLAQATDEARAWATDLQCTLETVLNITTDVRESFREAGDHVITHGDVEPYNVLMTTDGPALIDWDSVGPESASHELGHAAVSFADGRVDRVRGVLDAYVAAGGRQPASGPGLFMRPIGKALGDLTTLIEASLSGEPLNGWMGDGDPDGRIGRMILALPTRVADMRNIAEAVSR